MTGLMYRVLIVDDEPDFLRFLEMVLSKEFTIRTSVNGKEGLEEVYRNRPDLIVLDIMMPVMDGFEACKSIRENEEYDDVKIIMFSALSEEKDIQKAKECGADLFITKGVSMSEMKATIYKMIEGEKSEDSDS